MIGLVCENLNEINVAELYDNNITIFSNSHIAADNPNLCLFSKCMAYHFEGVLMVTNLQDAISMIDNNTCKKKIFWVQNIDWHRYSPLLYRDILKVFHNNDIKIMAKNKEVFNTLECFIREPDGIMESIDAEKILET